MNYMSRKQISACSHDRFAGRQAVWVFGFPYPTTSFEYLLAASLMNSSVNSTSAHQRPICSINDCVCLLIGDIANLNDHALIEK